MEQMMWPWAVGACAFAGFLGLWAWMRADVAARRLRHRRGVRGMEASLSDRREAADERVAGYLAAVARQMAAGSFRPWAPPPLRHPPWFEDRLRLAGLGDAVTVEACGEARVRLLVAGAGVGALVGSAASPEVAALLGAAGAVVGARAPRWAVERRCRCRAEELERHLSEMLDVVALGLRSGLSFDRSLALYGEHFDTLLSSSLAAAQRQWGCGLTSREEALRRVAASYDSALFGRVVENVVRSLRFGSSLAESLEGAAREARAAYRARKQEQVAKAPVKMMVPTAVLILPAMLMLVLGPVMLELIGGFS